MIHFAFICTVCTNRTHRASFIDPPLILHDTESSVNPQFLSLGWQQFIENPMTALFYAVPFIATTLFVGGVMIYSRYRKNNISAAIAEIDSHSDTPPSPQAESSENTLFTQIKRSLAKTRSQISDQLSAILSQDSPIDEEDLTKIHEVLIRADMGEEVARQVINHLKDQKTKTPLTGSEVTDQLAEHMIQLLNACPRVSLENQTDLQIILIAGVNGVGKTTTTGKLAAYYQSQGKKVTLCAADTFRAGAIDQLKVWGDRFQVPVVALEPGSDPAAVCYQATQRALKEDHDILLIDTAGRLHNKTDLMNQLAKMVRVIRKLINQDPHQSWLVIDGTTGQNAVKQADAFKSLLPLTGLIITKLDGTAKGGAVVGISNKLKLPIQFIGIGEQASDLISFKAEEYVKGLLERSEESL